MKEDLYKVYLDNIEKGKTAIKKEYVKKGYFSYYTEKEISNYSNSKRIYIDGVNACFDDFINKTIYELDNDVKNDRVLLLGKISKRYSENILNININRLNLLNYNISIGTDEIRHALKKHSLENEKERGQIPIDINDIKLIPELLINTELVFYRGINSEKREVYNFVSRNNKGKYVLLEFISRRRNLLGFQSLYITK